MTRQTGIKLGIVALIVVTAGVTSHQFGDKLSLDYLATQEATLRQYQQQHPQLIYGVAFLIYVAVTGLSIPGATVLTLLYGWFFGWLRGVILVSFASTTGATVAFLLSRYLLGTMIQQRFGDRLQQFNQALVREGPFYLFTLRLIPAVPFFVLNLVMGLTPLKVRTFWWVSQLGMLPGTILYVYAGASVPSLTELAKQGTSEILSVRVLTAFVALGLFPFLVRFLFAKIGSSKTLESLGDD